MKVRKMIAADAKDMAKLHIALGEQLIIILCQ